MPPSEPAGGPHVAPKTATPDHLIRALRAGGVWLRREFRFSQERHLLFNDDGEYIATVIRPHRAWLRISGIVVAAAVSMYLSVALLTPMLSMANRAMMLYALTVPFPGMILGWFATYRLLVPRNSLRGGTEIGDPPEALRVVERRGTPNRRRYDVFADGVLLGRAEELFIQSFHRITWAVRSADGTLHARVVETARLLPRGDRGLARRVVQPSILGAFEVGTDTPLGRLRPDRHEQGYWWLAAEEFGALDPRLVLVCLCLQRHWQFDTVGLRVDSRWLTFE